MSNNASGICDDAVLSYVDPFDATMLVHPNKREPIKGAPMKKNIQFKL